MAVHGGECRLAMELELGIAAGRYDDPRAHRYARELLMPGERFVALAALPDARLAARFGVPVEQVRRRRVELHSLRAGGRSQARPRPPGRDGRR